MSNIGSFRPLIFLIVSERQTYAEDHAHEAPYDLPDEGFLKLQELSSSLTGIRTIADFLSNHPTTLQCRSACLTEADIS